MAASKKSTVLGLCLWEGTDKPRRVDFVADNEAIESQLGGHIQNDNLHLNDTRRKWCGIKKVDILFSRIS